jgi:hypothetical protein
MELRKEMYKAMYVFAQDLNKLREQNGLGHIHFERLLGIMSTNPV